jgi:hypothetical protein
VVCVVDAGRDDVVVLAGGAMKVCVDVTDVTAVLVVPPAVVLLVDVVACVAVALAFSGGTGTAAPGRATEACPLPAESPEASDPACDAVEVDFTALPIPKPAAIAHTSNAPSSHHRRSMLPPSLRPVPVLIVLGLPSSRAHPIVRLQRPRRSAEPVACLPAR